jgi:hypothetical protein
MPIDMVVGTVMMRAGLLLPQGMSVTTDTYSKSWDVITGPDTFSMDRSLRAAGWGFFFTAAAIHAIRLGRREEKSARQAVDRILSKVQAQNFNCVEITDIATKHFLGIPYFSVCAHARQIQLGQTLKDDTERRRAQHVADRERN